MTEDYLFFSLAVLLGIVALLVVIWLSRKKTICPDCKQQLIKFEKAKNLQEFKERLLIGHICKNCGCVVDEKGNKISNEERIERSIRYWIKLAGILFIITSLKYIVVTIVLILVSFPSYLKFSESAFREALILCLKDLISSPGMPLYLIFNIIVFFFGGIGLLRLKKWARNLFIFMFPIILALHLLFVNKSPWILISTAVYILSLFFFTRAKVKEQFK